MARFSSLDVFLSALSSPLLLLLAAATRLLLLQLQVPDSRLVPLYYGVVSHLQLLLLWF
jgi:hypothetical protein